MIVEVVVTFCCAFYSCKEIVMDGYETLESYLGNPVVRQKFNAWRKSLGDLGEVLAKMYLEQEGYEILELNWRIHRKSEIDLIVRSAERSIVFVEVKTRSFRCGDRLQQFDAGIESVTRAKQRTIRGAARQYLNVSGVGYAALRFDLISIAVPELSIRFIEGERFLEVLPSDVFFIHIAEAFGAFNGSR